MKQYIKYSISLLFAFTSLAMAYPYPMAMQAMATPVKVTKPIVLRALLTVPQEATATNKNTPANSFGVGSFLFNPVTDVLQFSVSFAHMSSAPFMSHFHNGLPTTDGPILQTICGKPAPLLLGKVCSYHNYGVLQGKWVLNKTQAKELLHGEIYINIHTKLNPNGEIRGQIIPV